MEDVKAISLEILGEFWWAIVAVVFMMILFFAIRRVKHERGKQKEIDLIYQDESIMLNVYNRMSSFDYKEYKTLPGQEARLQWLRSLYPEFMEAVARRYSKSDYDLAVAKYLDAKIFRDETVPRTDAIRIYRTTAIAMSLNDYQVILDKKNEERHIARAKLAKLHAEKVAERAAELARQKKAAKKYWKSLSSAQKAEFRKASGKAARRNSLPESTSDYSIDVLYPLIMATQFGHISSDSIQSINNCESSSHGSSFGGSSGHFDGGSHHSYDGGSHSFDGGSSFASDSGGHCF